MAATYPDRQDRVGTRFLLGGISCVCAAIVTNPIDTIKTRMQMRGERGVSGQHLPEGSGSHLGERLRVSAEGSHHGKDYRGVIVTAKSIIRGETWRGFYKGPLSPSLSLPLPLPLSLSLSLLDSLLCRIFP
jgi:hypothetical protein